MRQSGDMKVFTFLITITGVISTAGVFFQHQWIDESLLECFISRALQGFQRLVLEKIFKII